MNQSPETAQRETFSTRRHEPGPPNDIVSEDNAAQSFLEEYQGQVAYCGVEGTWLVWTGFQWKRDGTGLAYEWMRQHVRNLTAERYPKARQRTNRTGFVAGVEKFSRSAREFATEVADWDADPFLLGTPRGTVDLRSGEMYLPRPADRITRIAAAGPTEVADCPIWNRFLQRAPAAIAS
jgi:putative DNA primase/helicase